MGKIYTFLSGLCLFLLAMPLYSVGQCSNQISISYYNSSGTLTTQTLNNGQSGGTVPVCASPSGAITVTLSSTSDALLEWFRLNTVNGVTTEQLIVSGSRGAGDPLRVTFQLSSQTVYRVRSRTLTCTGGTQNNFAEITLQPSLALTTSVASVCAGGAVTLSASGSSSGSYTWYQDGALQPETSATIARNNLTATTTFTVTTATTACGTSTQQLTVPVINLSLASNTATVCSGSTATFSANYSGTAATFRWYDNATNALLQTTADATSSSFTTPVLTSGATYRVEAAANDCGTTFTQTASVAIGALTAAVAPASPTVCTSSAVTLTASSNNPNATYQWQTVANNGTGSNIAGATGATYTVFTGNNTTPENYRVLVTAAGCTAAPTDVTINKVSTATGTVSPATDPTICAGAQTTLTASSNVSDATYVWYITNPGQPLSTAAAFTPSPTATTTYNVQITTGCGVVTQSRTVNVNPAVLVSPAAATINSGRTVTLTASGSSNGLYTWTEIVPGGASTVLAATSASITVAPTQDGTIYRATGTTANGCSNTAEARITVSSTPLPVELTSFEAAWKKSGPLLAWRTASEKNNAFFEVERSLNAAHGFEAVGRVAGAGTKSSPTDYRYTDLTKTLAGTVYYRLKQVDDNGQVSYSPVRTVLVPAGTAAFPAELYPNPSAHSVALKFEALTPGTATIVVCDVLGQSLLRQHLTTQAGMQTVELSAVGSLKAGVYYLTVEQGARRQVVKMVRE